MPVASEAFDCANVNFDGEFGNVNTMVGVLKRGRFKNFWHLKKSFRLVWTRIVVQAAVVPRTIGPTARSE